MANPLWFLGGLYLWDKLIQQERATRENARRLTELEKAVHDGQKDEQPLSVVDEKDNPGGCLTVLGCLASLIVLVGLVVFFGWLLFW